MEIKLQKDALDCGVVVIQSLHKYYYNNWIPLNKLKENANYGLTGISVLELSNIGDDYGLRLESFEGEFNSLKNLNIEEPIISIIKQNDIYHYVIITKIKGNRIYYYDPIFGKVTQTLSSFEKIFQNIIILVTKTSYQLDYQKEKEKLLYSNIRITILIIILSLISLSLSFVSTFYLKIILDKVIPSAMWYGLNYITLSFVFIALMKISATCFKSLMIKKIENKISHHYFNLYFNKLYFCNIYQLEKITKTDHLRRLGTIQNIASFKANFIFTISSEIIAFLFATAVLVWISPKVFAVIAIVSFLITLISFTFQKNINLKHQNVLKNNLDFSTKTIDLIYSQLEMKQVNLKNIVQKNLDQSLKNSFETNFKMFNLNVFHKTLIESVKILIPFIIIYISTLEIFGSQLSIGSMILFISIFTFFINPLDSFLSLILSVPIIKQDIHLLNFVLNFEEEKTNAGLENNDIKKLTFKNLSFEYERKQPLFKIHELNIENNIQLIGENGCGKSTFMKIVATYLNCQGNYKINGIDLSSYNVDSIRKNTYYGSNKTFLPNVTILQYITNNEKKNIEKLHTNINKYHLQNIFDEFGIKLENQIINNGNNFSSGQKQLIVLLPLLINDYQLILLDEVFDNIDYTNFNKLKNIIINIHKEKMFIEISHNNKYLFHEGEINFEKFNTHK